MSVRSFRAMTVVQISALFWKDDEMQLACQCAILGWLAMGFFLGVRACFEGSKAKPPMGYAGFIVVLALAMVLWAVFWTAGALSEIAAFLSVAR